MILERHCKIFKNAFRTSNACCCGRRNNDCSDVSEPVWFFLPDYDSKVVEGLVTLLYTGRAVCLGAEELENLNDLCRQLKLQVG